MSEQEVEHIELDEPEPLVAQPTVAATTKDVANVSAVDANKSNVSSKPNSDVLALFKKIERYHKRFPHSTKNVEGIESIIASGGKGLTVEQCNEALDLIRSSLSPIDGNMMQTIYFTGSKICETQIIPMLGYDATGLTDALSQNKLLKDKLDEMGIEFMPDKYMPPWMTVAMFSAATFLMITSANEIRKKQAH